MGSIFVWIHQWKLGTRPGCRQLRIGAQPSSMVLMIGGSGSEALDFLSDWFWFT